MKAIMISIKPKWVAKILNGEKTIEIRKRFPNNYRGWVYIYCTKDKELLHKNCANIYWIEDKYFKAKNKKIGTKTQPCLNGKVVARFWCDKVEEIVDCGSCYLINKDYPHTNEVARQSCLDFIDLKNYLKGKNGGAIHISKLEIFDKPRELSEFYKVGHYEDLDDCFTDEKQINGKWCIPLKKAPQSWCYIEE